MGRSNVQFAPNVRAVRFEGKRHRGSVSERTTAGSCKAHLRREVLETGANGRGEERESQGTAERDGEASADGDTDQASEDVVGPRPHGLAFCGVQLRELACEERGL